MIFKCVDMFKGETVRMKTCGAAAVSVLSVEFDRLKYIKKKLLTESDI